MPAASLWHTSHGVSMPSPDGQPTRVSEHGTTRRSRSDAVGGVTASGRSARYARRARTSTTSAIGATTHASIPVSATSAGTHSARDCGVSRRPSTTTWRSWVRSARSGRRGFGHGRWRPIPAGIRPRLPRSRLGLRADVTSGDSNPDDDRLGTFNALFPRGAYFGLIASTGPANHFDLHPQFETTIDRRLTLMADWLFLWRTETSDGLYSVSGRLLRASAGTSAHFVGHAPGLKLQWQAHRSVFARFDVSTFTAGPFIRESGPGRRITFVSASTSYRF